VTYDQIGNDPVQLTSKESVEFRLSHTKREPKLLALNLFSISPACFAMEQTPFNDYHSWRVTFRFVMSGLWIVTIGPYVP